MRPESLSAEHAKAFDDPAVARAYRFRPPYPPQVFDELAKLLGARPGWVLDLGCGTGLLARTLIRHVGRVDAVDASAAMIEEARRQPGGFARAIRWIVSSAETARFAGPYGLAVAGDSLHWMDWEIVLPRVARALAPGAFLAIVELDPAAPWRDELLPLIRRYSREPTDVRGFRLPEELARRGLFAPAGELVTEPVAWRQGVDEYVESLHARSSLARRRLGADAAAFDDGVRALLRAKRVTSVTLTLVATISWGTPAARPPRSSSGRRRAGTTRARRP